MSASRAGGASPAARAGRRLPALGLAAAVVTVYWPVRRGGFLWDDIEEIAQNPVLAAPGGLGRIWWHPSGLDYYPLKTTVQWLQWHAWGSDVLGYHLTNIALHAVATVLFWQLLKALFAGKLPAGAPWLGALGFAVHPLCVESVAWMAELKNTLSLPLLLMAMICFLRFEGRAGTPCPSAVVPPGRNYGRTQPGPPYLDRTYLLSLLFFLLSLLSKTSGVMFPVIVLLHAWWRRGRIGRDDWRNALPFFALSLVLGGLTLVLQEHRSIGSADLELGSVGARLALPGLVAVFYAVKSVCPCVLLPMYPRWPVVPAPGQFLPWLVLMLGFFWLGRAAARGAPSTAFRTVLFALGFFFLNLAPVSGLVPISHLRFTWAMDHLAYLPLLGLVGLAAAAGGSLWRRAAQPAARAALTAGVVLVLAGLTVSSRAYAARFRDSVALWSLAVEGNPSASLARYNLGVAWDQAGRPAEAEASYRAALRLRPAYPEAHVNLGNLLRAQGQRAAAVGEYEAAIRARPEYPEAESNLCAALLESGAVAAAIHHGERAAELKPDYAEALANLGNALVRARRFDEAFARFRAALRLRPDYAQGHNGFGVALAYSGRLGEAATEFRRALALSPGYGEARENLRQVLQAAAR